MYPKLDLQAFYSLFHVTFGQMTLLWGSSSHVNTCDVISCHVTITFCKLQPCKSSKTRKLDLQAFYSTSR